MKTCTACWHFCAALLLATAAASSGFYSAMADEPVVSVDGGKVVSIDVEDMILNAAKLQRTPRVLMDSACPDYAPPRGMSAHQWCRMVYHAANLKVEKIIEVKVGELDISKIPTYMETKNIGFRNGWSSTPYPYDNTVTIESQQSVNVSLNEVLTKVSDYEGNISINASILKDIGIRASEKTGNSITYSVTRANQQSMAERFMVQDHISFQVPPCWERTADYSDVKRSVSVPVTIKGLLTGAIVDRNERPGKGQEYEVNRLEYLPESARTFELHGAIQFLGSDRSIHITLGEARIYDGACKDIK